MKPAGQPGEAGCCEYHKSRVLRMLAQVSL